MPESISLPKNGTFEGKEVMELKPGESFEAKPYVVTKDHEIVTKDGKSVKTAPKIEFAEKTVGVIAAGSYAPNAPANRKWRTGKGLTGSSRIS